MEAPARQGMPSLFAASLMQAPNRVAAAMEGRRTEKRRSCAGRNRAWRQQASFTSHKSHRASIVPSSLEAHAARGTQVDAAIMHLAELSDAVDTLNALHEAEAKPPSGEA